MTTITVPGTVSDTPVLADKITFCPKAHRILEANQAGISKDSKDNILTWYNSFENQDPQNLIGVTFTTDTAYDLNSGIIYLNAPGSYHVTASWNKQGTVGHNGINFYYAPCSNPITITDKITFTGFSPASFNAHSVTNDGCMQTSTTIYAPPQHVPAKIMVTAAHESVTGEVLVKGHHGSPSAGGSRGSFCTITYLGA